MSILYSIVPAEIVFSNSTEIQYPKLIETVYLGERLIVSHVERDKYMIQRLISTSPKAFINPALQPGKIVNLNM